MHIITRKTLRQFWERHPDAAEVLKDWHDNAEHANWTSPRQVKADYPSASITTAPRGGGRANSNFRAHRYGPDHPPWPTENCPCRPTAILVGAVADIRGFAGVSGVKVAFVVDYPMCADAFVESVLTASV